MWENGTWTKGSDNPFAEANKVALGDDARNGSGRVGRLQKVFSDVVGWPEIDSDAFLDELLTEIAGETNIVVQKRGKKWVATLDNGWDLEDHSLEEIIKADAAWVRRSCYEVTCNEMFAWVNISDGIGEILLQGSPADDFIAEARSLWAEVMNVTTEEVMLHLAKPYIESAT